MHVRLPILLSSSLLLLSALPSVAPASGSAGIPIVGLPCEDCAVALVGLPAEPPTVARLTAPDEPGEPLQLSGIVRDADGHARAGVIVYAHQTDHRGIYPEEGLGGPAEVRRHGRLRGWARTDAEGRYRFETIRPGGYPDSGLPQHIHLNVIEPGCATYYIDDVMFEDDPRLTPALRRKLDQGRGGRGIVTPVRSVGIWQAQRDIVLGAQIPGYHACEPAAASRP
ncbi:MAG: hypothetical protein DI564_01680 [Rhodanobacter denitrificans]|uniref:Intradiol ring-cleavage dioxygenases domain-containing protein n=1 Tax=Rhodanobacter denitrificans TaxID=666685 RepID=A0A2W5KQP0_9GAMM|nr:MAG: hypothetical protein DI564_01680 [Rhodanobacter denitrificans]